MPLPTPKGRQREVLVLPSQGHHVVLGTAGSGKTALAILRAAYLADKSTDHFGRTLLVTFNRTLVTYMKYLNESETSGVNIETYHKFATGYLSSRGRLHYNEICSAKKRLEFIRIAIKEISAEYASWPIYSWPIKRFSDEFKWIAQQVITTAEEYYDSERIGRGTVRIVRKHRNLVFGSTNATYK